MMLLDRGLCYDYCTRDRRVVVITHAGAVDVDDDHQVEQGRPSVVQKKESLVA